MEEFYLEENENCGQIKFNVADTNIIDLEISKLLEMGVIVPAAYEQGQFMSPIFVRPKKIGEHRMILNLKKLEYIYSLLPFQNGYF